MSTPDGKFELNGRLVLEVKTDSAGAPRNLTIPDGLQIDFEINRAIQSETQQARFTVRNLSEATRDLIYKDYYDYTQLRAIQFYAGYGKFTPLIFNGQILQAYSWHESGATEATTEIVAFDGGFQRTNGFISGWGVPQQCVPAGTSIQTVLQYLANKLPSGSGNPIIGSFPSQSMSPEALMGSTWDLIQQKSGNQGTIDNNQVKIMNVGDVLADVPVPLIDSTTGLLGSPRRSGATVVFEMLFEPRFTLYQPVTVKSSFNKQFNGSYRVNGFKHRGSIARSVATRNTTTASFYYGTGVFNPVAGAVFQG